MTSEEWNLDECLTQRIRSYWELETSSMYSRASFGTEHWKDDIFGRNTVVK